MHKIDPMPTFQSVSRLLLASDVEGDVDVGVIHPGRLQQQGGRGKTLIGFAVKGAQSNVRCRFATGVLRPVAFRKSLYPWDAKTSQGSLSSGFQSLILASARLKSI